MYDISKLTTSEQCRTVRENARKQGNREFSLKALERNAEIIVQKQNPASPLELAYLKALAVYELLLTEKNGRTTLAQRTRQKVRNKELLPALKEWALDNGETDGLKLVLDEGVPQYSFEYLVVELASQFSEDEVRSAREKLIRNGIEPPQQRG